MAARTSSSARTRVAGDEARRRTAARRPCRRPAARSRSAALRGLTQTTRWASRDSRAICSPEQRRVGALPAVGDDDHHRAAGQPRRPWSSRKVFSASPIRVPPDQSGAAVGGPGQGDVGVPGGQRPGQPGQPGREHERLGPRAAHRALQQLQVDPGVRLHRPGDVGDQHDPPRRCCAAAGTPGAPGRRRCGARGAGSGAGRAGGRSPAAAPSAGPAAAAPPPAAPSTSRRSAASSSAVHSAKSLCRSRSSTLAVDQHPRLVVLRLPSAHRPRGVRGRYVGPRPPAAPRAGRARRPAARAALRERGRGGVTADPRRRPSGHRKTCREHRVERRRAAHAGRPA